jgi:hypothetical protein
MERRRELLLFCHRRSSPTIRLEHGRRSVRLQVPLARVPSRLPLEHRHQTRRPLVVRRMHHPIFLPLVLIRRREMVARRGRARSLPKDIVNLETIATFPMKTHRMEMVEISQCRRPAFFRIHKRNRRLEVQVLLVRATQMHHLGRRLRLARLVEQWRRRQARLGTHRQLSPLHRPSAILNLHPLVVTQLLSLCLTRTRNRHRFKHLSHHLDHHKTRLEALVAWCRSPTHSGLKVLLRA